MKQKFQSSFNHVKDRKKLYLTIDKIAEKVYKRRGEKVGGEKVEGNLQI
jgi:hypothetical protein